MMLSNKIQVSEDSSWETSCSAINGNENKWNFPMSGDDDIGQRVIPTDK